MKTRVRALAFVLAGVLGAGFAAAADKPAKTGAKAEPKLSAAEVEKQLDAAFPAFLKDPSAANFLKVHRLAIAHPAYAPYSSELDDVLDLLGEKKFKEVREQLGAAKYNLLLSPRAHLFLADAASGLNDKVLAKREAEIADKCIAGIRATGDGSEKKPMIVTRSSDAYDVARSLHKRVAGVRRHVKEEKHYEVLHCSDNSDLWFDATAPFGAMAKTFKPRPPKKQLPKQESPQDKTLPPEKDKSDKDK